MKPHLVLVNKTSNQRTLGFGDGDLVGGIDQLIHALFIHGETAAALPCWVTMRLTAGRKMTAAAPEDGRWSKYMKYSCIMKP